MKYSVVCDNCSAIFFVCEIGGHCCPECGSIVMVEAIHEPEQTVFEIGTVIKINSTNHPLHDEIGLIMDLKHQHYRVEFNNTKIWVPQHWVEIHEPEEHD